jgi:holo-[acyl-carrier protein] synthase
MIYGIGIDIVKTERIKRILEHAKERFLNRVFSPEEILKESVDEISGKFAAKEAFVKALGTGFSKGVVFKDIKVLNERTGKPFIQVSDNLKERFGLGQFKFHVSISHDSGFAISVVIVEKP